MTQTIDQDSPPTNWQAPIANDNVSGPVTLTIEPSVKFFKASGCGTWTKR